MTVKMRIRNWDLVDWACGKNLGGIKDGLEEIQRPSLDFAFYEVLRPPHDDCCTGIGWSCESPTECICQRRKTLVMEKLTPEPMSRAKNQLQCKI